MDAAALSDLADALDRGESIPPGPAAELAEAIRAAMTGRRRLDEALGLRTWGGLSIARQVALDRRDAALWRLWRTQAEWRDLEPAEAGRLMAQSADRYERTRWSRERHDLGAPGAEPAATWWSILGSDVPMPGARQMGRILARRDIREPI